MAFQCYSKLAHGSVTERKKRGLPTKDTCTTPIIPKWKMELIAHEIFTKHFTDISAVTELACKMIEEHAKAYVYSFSSRRRVHGWQNIKIRLFV